MQKISKLWRKLPKDQKLRIPVDYFQINEKEVNNIRKIENSSERLIAAAKLQYELFKTSIPT